MTTTAIEAAKKYVGNANARPASRSPRRLPKKRINTTPTVISRLKPPSPGIAEVTALVPAAD